MRALVAVVLGLASAAVAQPGQLPDKHIPPTVMLELRTLEHQFDLALGRDCAPEKCASKGCVYRDHVVVDLPRNSSLPGLPQQEGLGAVPPQDYLTQANCDFAYEKSVSQRDALALVKRLEQRLSKGWLKVTVGHQLLEPISASLADSPPPKPEPVAPDVKKPEVPLAPEPPKEWDSKVALRELWVWLLPHAWWMVAVFLGTLSVLVLIWALRRLGRESLEEKALAAQMLAGPVVTPAAESKKDEGVAPAPAPLVPSEDEAFVEAQRRLWQARVDDADLGKDGGGLAELLRDWLRAREFTLLAKAVLVFGSRLSSALPSDGELAARKVEFAEFLRGLDESTLPKDADFFRTLHHHTVSSSLLAQSDAETYRSIGLEFGAGGVVGLMEAMGPRPGALLFALVPGELQPEVVRALNPRARQELAAQLLASNRMSAEERNYLFSAIDTARAGGLVSAAPRGAANEITDRGHPFDAAGALSVVLPLLSAAERKGLLAAAQTGGVLPEWLDDVLFPEMFAKLPDAETRGDVLLEVDVRALAAWLSVQGVAVREAFIGGMPDSLRSALKSAQFTSRAEQLRLARVGRDALVVVFKRLYGRGVTSFSQLAA
jgi:hypothetical protein